jgi:O-antigen/teichoic acid export membrane protein
VNIPSLLQQVSSLVQRKLGQDARNRQALLTGIITLMVRVIALGTSIISIPLTSQYLGQEQFGIWLLLSTLLNWIALADLGLTNSLVNNLSTALAKGDRLMAQRSIASVFFPMLIGGLLLLGLPLILSHFLNYQQFLNLQLSAAVQRDTHWAITIALCFFAAKIPLSIPRCIFSACQQGYLYQAWIGYANILSLIVLLIAQHYHASLPWLLGSFFGAVLLGDILAGIDIFYFRHPGLRPQLVYYDWRLFQDLLHIGWQFWIVQVAAICIFQTDLIIVAKLFGVIEVATYGVLLKLFSITEAVSSSFINPLWPAYSDAQARQDDLWIKKTFRGSLILTTIWSIGAGGLTAFFAPVILQHWLGDSVYIAPHLPVLMLLTYTLLAISQCIAILVNGLGRLKIQSWIAIASAICNLSLSFLLGQSIGIAGVTVATSISILIFSIFCQLFFNKIYQFV